MKAIRKLIELLVKMEICLTRSKATRRAITAAVRMALNGCRV